MAYKSKRMKHLGQKAREAGSVSIEEAVKHVFIDLLGGQLAKELCADILQLLGLPAAAAAKMQVYRNTGRLCKRQAPRSKFVHQPAIGMIINLGVHRASVIT